MRIGLLRFSWIAALAASWGLTWVSNTAPAQERFHNGVLAAAPSGAEASPSRITEIQVELALLGDPITFPYFLEARVDGPRLRLNGFVPNATVQEHAVKLARLNSSLTVVDDTRVHSSLAAHATPLPPEKLYACVHTALAKSLPGSVRSLRIECDSHGKVFVSGPVQDMEQKLALSQSLRRLHGCGHVVNATHLTGEVSAADADVVPAGASVPVESVPTATNAPAFEESSEIRLVQAVEPSPVPTAAPPANPSSGPFGGFFNKLFGKRTPEASEAPIVPTSRGPVKITNVGEPKSAGWGTPPRRPLIPGLPTSRNASTNPQETSGPLARPTDGGIVRKAKALSPAQVKSRLESAFPKSRPIVVTPEGGNKLKVELSVRTSEESNDIAGRLLSLPELQTYDINLHIRIETPVNNR